MHVWTANSGLQPVRVRTSQALMVAVLRAILVSSFLPIITLATILTSTLCIRNIRALGHGLQSVRTAVCVLEALFGYRRGITIAIWIRIEHLGAEKKTFVAFRACVGTIDLALIACCRSAVETFAGVLCFCTLLGAFIRKHTWPY